VALAQAAAKPKNDLAGLVKDIQDKDPQVRTRAAVTLSELGPKAQPAIPALLKIVEDEDPQVRLTAALVIARIERRKAELAKKVVKESILQPTFIQTQQQAAAKQMVMLYILSTTGASAPPEIDQAFERLGYEAIPALVEGINFVALNQIGHC
jgi:hypothetical protein